MSDQPIFNTDDTDSDSDGALERAVDKARRSFKFFWRELSWEYRRVVPGLDSAAVKVMFPIDDPRPSDAPGAEFMWVGELYFDGRVITGRLMNEPEWIRDISVGDEVAVLPDQMIDWMYTIGDQPFGGYTVQAMRADLSPAERREHDEAWGLEFGDPQVVYVAPAPMQTEDGDWRRDPERRGITAEEAEELEHPMSLNAGSGLAEAIAEQPEMVSQVDEDGWTTLHFEALAGNLKPVQTLLAHGADPAARTPRGETPLELARLMAWPRVVAALEAGGGH